MKPKVYNSHKMTLTMYLRPSASWCIRVPGVSWSLRYNATVMAGPRSSEQPACGGGMRCRRRTHRSITNTSSPERTITAQLHVASTSLSQRWYTAFTCRNRVKKSELMLMRPATVYSSSFSQVVLIYPHPFRRNSLLK